jgi:predicted small metal-binding protein
VPPHVPASIASLLLRCADVHPVACDAAIIASSRQELVERACAHGASAHGFTPTWYSEERLALIRAASASLVPTRA